MKGEQDVISEILFELVSFCCRCDDNTNTGTCIFIHKKDDENKVRADNGSESIKSSENPIISYDNVSWINQSTLETSQILNDKNTESTWTEYGKEKSKNKLRTPETPPTDDYNVLHVVVNQSMLETSAKSHDTVTIAELNGVENGREQSSNKIRTPENPSMDYDKNCSEVTQSVLKTCGKLEISEIGVEVLSINKTRTSNNPILDLDNNVSVVNQVILETSGNQYEQSHSPNKIRTSEYPTLDLHNNVQLPVVHQTILELSGNLFDENTETDLDETETQSENKSEQSPNQIRASQKPTIDYENNVSDLVNQSVLELSAQLEIPEIGIEIISPIKLRTSEYPTLDLHNNVQLPVVNQTMLELSGNLFDENTELDFTGNQSEKKSEQSPKQNPPMDYEYNASGLVNQSVMVVETSGKLEVPEIGIEIISPIKIRTSEYPILDLHNNVHLPVVNQSMLELSGNLFYENTELNETENQPENKKQQSPKKTRSSENLSIDYDNNVSVNPSSVEPSEKLYDKNTIADLTGSRSPSEYGRVGCLNKIRTSENSSIDIDNSLSVVNHSMAKQLGQCYSKNTVAEFDINSDAICTSVNKDEFQTLSFVETSAIPQNTSHLLNKNMTMPPEPFNEKQGNFIINTPFPRTTNMQSLTKFQNELSNQLNIHNCNEGMNTFNKDCVTKYIDPSHSIIATELQMTKNKDLKITQEENVFKSMPNCKSLDSEMSTLNYERTKLESEQQTFTNKLLCIPAENIPISKKPIGRSVTEETKTDCIGMLDKPTVCIPPISLENALHRNIDLLKQCKNDYSAVTPAVVTHLHYGIGSVISSTGVTCQRESTFYEITGHEHTSSDKHESQHLLNVRPGIKLIEDIDLVDHQNTNQILCEKELFVGVKQEIEPVICDPKFHGFFKNDMHDYDNSSQSKSIDINNSSICSYTKPILLEDSQFKYTLEEEEELNLSDEALVIKDTHLHVIEQNDVHIDINSQLKLEETTGSAELLGIQMPDVSVKSNVILYFEEPTVFDQKKEINAVLSTEEGSVPNQCESSRMAKSKEKLQEISIDCKHQDQDNHFNSEINLVPEQPDLTGCDSARKGNRNIDDKEQIGQENVGIGTSFETIEDMTALRSSPDFITCAQTAYRTNNINPDYDELNFSAPDTNSDDSEDYQLFPTTQCFKPIIGSDMIGGYPDDGLYPRHECSQEYTAGCTDNGNVEEEAVVPAPSLKRNISDVYEYKGHHLSDTDMLKQDTRPSQLPISACFKWNSSSNFNGELEEESLKVNDGVTSSADYPYLKQLVTCTRPIRLGLSKRQKTNKLHPHLQ